MNVSTKKIHPELKKFIPMVKVISETFGRKCEVLVHDFSDPKHSIIAIEGNVTGRKIGDGITDFALSIWRKGGYGEKKENMVTNYKNKTKDGKILRSSTLLIRDDKNVIVGCFCINYDLTEHIMFGKVIEELCTTIDLDKRGSKEGFENFSSDINEVLRDTIRKAIDEVGIPVSLMKKSDKLLVVKIVDEKGGFLIRGSVNQLAAEMNVSRYTIYNYLDELKIRNIKK